MTGDGPQFAPRGSTEEIETGLGLAPKFDRDGLIPAVVADAGTGEVLMMAYMDRIALARTIETGEAWFWSRSRREHWRKGATSGNTLKVTDLRLDCDQDAVLVRAEVAGSGVVCHQGFRSCFYRSATLGEPVSPKSRLRQDPHMPRR